MKAAQYLINNFKWTFFKPKTNLVGKGKSVAQLFEDLHQYCQDCNFDGLSTVEVSYTGFDLDSIFLSKATNEGTRHLKTLYFHYANLYSNVQRTLQDAKPFTTADGRVVIEYLAHAFVVATQCSKQDNLWKEYKNEASCYLDLTENDLQHMDAVYALYRCKYYCNLYRLAKDGAVLQLAALTDNFDLVCHKWVDANFYSRNFYKTSRLFSALDCFGNTATIFDGQRTGVNFTTKLLVNSRNVFDTFTQYKFGKKSANFRANGNSAELCQQYLVYKNVEVRKLLLNFKGKKTANCKLSLTFSLFDANSKCFCTEDTLCIAKQGMYVALLCIVNDNVALPEYTFLEGANQSTIKLNLPLNLTKQMAVKVQFVTIYAKDMAELQSTVDCVKQIGFTNNLAYNDTFCQGEQTNVATNLTSSCTNLYETDGNCLAVTKYCYRFGDENLSTLADGVGNFATLVNGFASVGGEALYAICGSKLTKINSVAPQIEGDVLKFSTPYGSLSINHNGAKTYTFSAKQPSKLLWLLPLEEVSKVSAVSSGLKVTSASRSFVVNFSDTPVCFTTNALECNGNRLRYKLSNDLSAGTTLAVCFDVTDSLTITLTNLTPTQSENPIITNCLNSAYLACYNQNTVYMLTNRLVLPNAFSLASTVYTHPNWLKNYLKEAIKNNCEFFYYSNTGKKVYDVNVFAVLLASIQLATVNEVALLEGLKDTLNAFLAGNAPVTHKALVLKGLVALGLNKVDNLVAYSKLKKQITADKNLYSYAQAIGAVDLLYPSKQRLRDVVNQHKLPKSWYYHCIFQNLYRLSLYGNKISVKPLSSSGGFVAEDFTLNLVNKKIYVTFTPSPTASINYQNGVYFQPLSLKNVQSVGKVVVKY